MEDSLGYYELLRGDYDSWIIPFEVWKFPILYSSDILRKRNQWYLVEVKNSFAVPSELGRIEDANADRKFERFARRKWKSEIHAFESGAIYAQLKKMMIDDSKAIGDEKRRLELPSIGQK